MMMMRPTKMRPSDTDDNSLTICFPSSFNINKHKQNDDEGDADDAHDYMVLGKEGDTNAAHDKRRNDHVTTFDILSLKLFFF